MRAGTFRTSNRPQRLSTPYLDRRSFRKERGFEPIPAFAFFAECHKGGIPQKMRTVSKACLLAQSMVRAGPAPPGESVHSPSRNRAMTYRKAATVLGVLSLLGMQLAIAQETMPEPVPLNNMPAAATARFTLQEAKERAIGCNKLLSLA